MCLHVHTTSGRAVVALPAEVDITNIEEIRAAARDQLWEPIRQLREIVFDLTGTEFIGSEAVGLIRETRRRSRAHGVALRVVAPSPTQRRILDCLGLGPETMRGGTTDPAPKAVLLPRQRSRGPDS